MSSRRQEGCSGRVSISPLFQGALTMGKSIHACKISVILVRSSLHRAFQKRYTQSYSLFCFPNEELPTRHRIKALLACKRSLQQTNVVCRQRSVPGISTLQGRKRITSNDNETAFLGLSKYTQVGRPSFQNVHSILMPSVCKVQVIHVQTIVDANDDLVAPDRGYLHK